MTEVNYYYRVESTESLSPPAWTTVADALPGNGATLQLIDLGAAVHPKRFYRAQSLSID